MKRNIVKIPTVKTVLFMKKLSVYKQSWYFLISLF